MNLASLQPNPTKIDQLPILRNKAGLPMFNKCLRRISNLRFGEVGRKIIEDSLFEKTTSIDKPHYNSLRPHPVTGKPIHGERMYAKKTRTNPEVPQPSTSTSTEPEALDEKVSARAPASRSSSTEKKTDGSQKTGISFVAVSDEEDEDAIPLTEAAQDKLDRDIGIWNKQEDTKEKKHKIRKDHDDDCATLIVEHISPEMMQEIEISPLYTVWRDLPHECVDRSVLFVRLLKDLFSGGNSTEAVDAMARLFNLKQSDPHPSTFFNSVLEEFSALIPLIEDKNNPGMINGLQLQTIVLINGLNKTSSANKDGIKKHLEDNPEDALNKPAQLIAACLKAHQSDLNTDRISDQSSAFAAVVTNTKNTPKPAGPKWEYREDKKDHSEIPGAVHCKNCHTLTKGLFFYNHPTSECKRTPASEKARQERAQEKSKNKFHAKAAEVEKTGLSEVEQLKLEIALQNAFFAGKYPGDFEA